MNEDLDGRIAAMAASQHGLVSKRQAVSIGATRAVIRHRLESGRWAEVAPGVYLMAGAPFTPVARALATVLAAGPNAAASHRMAAALHGIPGFGHGRIELTVGPGAPPPVRGALVHQSTLVPAEHRRLVDAVPCTTVARTLFDLCAVVHPKRVARALDSCLARGWVTVPACWRVLDELAEHGRNGTQLMRLLLDERGKGYVAPTSELEARLLELLAGAGLPLPRREVDLGDRDQWIGRVEFVYADARVLIEADSRLHHSGLLDFESDRERDNRFVAAGYRVLRITWTMVTERPHEVVTLIRSALHWVA